jgi:hypothetical protein
MAIPARVTGSQSIQYLRAPIAFGLGYTGVTQLGTIPANSIVLRTWVVVTTAFNNGSTNTMTIGTSGSAAAFGTGIALGTVGVITGGTALATATVMAPTADTSLTATMASTGAAATTGAGYVVVEYIPVP